MRTKILALAFTLLAVTASAVEPVNQYVSADDVSVAILVRYFPGISTGTSATVANVQATSMTFQVAAAAYTGFECPVAGALGGIIDLTNAACNSVGEVLDIINATSPTFASGFFRAVAVDALRSDIVTGFLADAGTQATRVDGLPVYFDVTANFAVGEGRALLPGNCRTDIRCFVTRAGSLLENPYAGQQTVVQWVEGLSTYGAGTSVLNIYSVKPSNKAAGSEAATTLWNEAMGATTVNKQFTQFQYIPLRGKTHEKVIVRITNSNAQASVRLLVAAEKR